MPNCSITFLFDSGQVFAESFNLTEPHPQSLPDRLNRIVQARLPLLAACVRIVRLKARSHPVQRVDIRGTGSEFAWPRDGLNLMRIGGNRMANNVCLRGIPDKFFDGDKLKPMGATAVANLGMAQKECGAFAVLQGEPWPITDLQVTGKTLLSYKKDKPATRHKLISILGKEKALLFWEELKKKKPPGRR